jgi:hypothetical protein
MWNGKKFNLRKEKTDIDKRKKAKMDIPEILKSRRQ